MANKIITIGRQFGSGGRELGRRLAENLGFEYYDKEIIEQIAEKTSLSVEYVQNVVEHKPHSLFPITIGQSLAYSDNLAYQEIQAIYQAKVEILKELATKSSCVIVGRCADVILEEFHPFRIFVYASMDSRIKRCLERNSGETISPKELEKYIKQIDKNRAKYYEHYTKRKWADIENFDLCINTTNTEIKQIVPVIAKIFKD